MRKFLSIVAALFLCFLPAFSQNVKTLEKQRAQLEKDISILNRQLAQNSKNSSQALNNLTLLKNKINAREKLIQECDKTLRVLEDSIRTTQQEMDRLQARHDTLALYYGRLVRGAYKNRDSRIWYMYILSSQSLGQGFKRASYLRDMSSEMSRQALVLREMSAQLAVEKERLDNLHKEADEMRRKVVAERSTLKSEANQADQQLAKLKKERNKYEKQLQEKNKQKQALNKKIADLIRKENEKAAGKGKKGSSGTGKTTSTAIDTQLSNEFAANKGKLPWPVEGAVVERFGKHTHPVYQNVEMPQNNGVTLSVKAGTQAKAVFNGTVTQVVVLPGFNQCVLVNHGAYYTLYTKLKSVAVKVGDKVKTGQVVGTVDTIGGENLFHFELWKGDVPQNPEGWLRN